MADPALMDRIMRGLVDTGTAPHYAELARVLGLFVEDGRETRRHMLDADYLSAWFPRRAAERRAYLERIGKTTALWLGTPDPEEK